MACLLKIIGENLDVNMFLKTLKLQGFQKRYKGEFITTKRKLQYSYVSKCVSHSDLFKQQKDDIYRYLCRHKKKIMKARVIQGIQYFTIDFNITSTINNNTLIQSMYFEREFIDLCSELKITFEITLYAKNMNEILEERFANTCTD